MSGPRLTALNTQFQGIRDGIDTINRAAAAESRDLTDAEAKDLDVLFERAEALKPQIETEAAREASIMATADVLARVGGHEVPTVKRAAAANPDLTPGEFLAAYYSAYHPNGNSTPDEFVQRAAAYIDRAQQATGDTAGILPRPIIGEVIKLADSLRPCWNSLTARTMPDKGKTFERPRITQRVTMATQTEGQALASQKMTLTSDTITKATQGGFLDITHQDIDWTEPSALEIVVQDFVDMYAEWTEGLATDFVEGLIGIGDTASNGSTYSPWVTTNVGTIVDSYIDGFVKVYGKAKRMPDTIYLDLAGWALLATTFNTNNDMTALALLRSTLAEFGATNVRIVVAPQFAANTRVIACSSLLEAYEQQKGLLRAELPSTLVVQLAYAGYTAFHGRHEGVVQLLTDPTP